MIRVLTWTGSSRAARLVVDENQSIRDARVPEDPERARANMSETSDLQRAASSEQKHEPVQILSEQRQVPAERREEPPGQHRVVRPRLRQVGGRQALCDYIRHAGFGAQRRRRALQHLRALRGGLEARRLQGAAHRAVREGQVRLVLCHREG